MQNAQRTGLQNATTPFNSTTVPALTLRWSYNFSAETAGSPIIANGVVYVSSGAGSVAALDERTGTQIWRDELGAAITMTPLYDSGMLFVATHNAPARFFALDAQTGATRWQVSFAGSERGEPLAVGGTLYVPEAGGDPPGCHQGGIHAFQEMTGVSEWNWVVDSKPNDGGSVWAPISYDGRYLVFGTGNSCSLNVANANAVVQLTLGGQQNWLVPQQVNSQVDDDWGGGAAVFGGHEFVANKNGKLYSLNDLNGTIAWSDTLSRLDGSGSIGSPATNGSVVVAPSGFVTDPPNPTAFIGGYDLNGNLLWQAPTFDFTAGGAALTNDVAFISIDDKTVALNVATGAQLWSFKSPFSAYFYASPAVDSSGVYAVDRSGAVYAFGVGTTASSAALDRLRAEARNAAPPSAPYGHIFRTEPGGVVRAKY